MCLTGIIEDSLNDSRSSNEVYLKSRAFDDDDGAKRRRYWEAKILILPRRYTAPTDDNLAMESSRSPQEISPTCKGGYSVGSPPLTAGWEWDLIPAIGRGRSQ